MALLDIAACRCKTFTDCTCSKKNKVPTLEHAFLKDQRNERKMHIGSIDVVTTRKAKKRLNRSSSLASSLASLALTGKYICKYFLLHTLNSEHLQHIIFL